MLGTRRAAAVLKTSISTVNYGTIAPLRIFTASCASEICTAPGGKEANDPGGGPSNADDGGEDVLADHNLL